MQNEVSVLFVKKPVLLHVGEDATIAKHPFFENILSRHRSVQISRQLQTKAAVFSQRCAILDILLRILLLLCSVVCAIWDVKGN